MFRTVSYGGSKVHGEKHNKFFTYAGITKEPGKKRGIGYQQVKSKKTEKRRKKLSALKLGEGITLK